MWTVGGFEFVTLVAQSICFARGKLNPKSCAFTHAWILIMYQIQFIISCVGLGSDDLYYRDLSPKMLHHAVAWSVSSMIVGLVCV
jgi:hypothetical protein